MRTGAIFARGSCRALKWTALLGVVFMLGAGSAGAQLRLPGTGVVAETDLSKLTLAENGSSKPVRITVNVPAGTATRTDFTVTLTIPGDTDIRWTTVADTDSRPVSRTVTATTLTYTFRWTVNTASSQQFSEIARLRAVDDDDTVDDTVNIGVVTADDTTGGTLAVTVTDNDVQEYELVGPSDNKLNEGEQITLQLSAKKPLAAAETTVLRVELDSENDDSDYNFAGATGTVQEFTLGDSDSGELQSNVSTNVTLISEENDVDRKDDIITLTVTYAADKGKKKRGELAIDPPLELTVVDQHKLPSVEIASNGITIVVDKKATPVKTLTEGQTGTVKLVADRGTNTDDVPDDEDIEVTLKAMAGSTADSADYDLRGSPVKIGAAAGKNGTGSFTLEVEVDQDIGNEELMLMATVSGEDEYGTSGDDHELGPISFVDATIPKIEPKTADEVHDAIDDAQMEGAGDNGRWTAAETMTLMASDLFDWPKTTTSVVLGNSISEDQQIATASTSNDSLIITAVSAGMTEISVTATVTGEASGFVATQTVSTSATVKFPITVDADAITVMSQADVNAAVAAAIKKAADMASSGQWEPGGATAMVPVDELFAVPESIRAIFDAQSSDTGDVEAGISSDKMYVTLMPKSAGTAKITVTAADTASGGGTATVSFDATVVAQASIAGKSQAEVNKVFMDAGADDLVAQGPSIAVDMSKLFVFGDTANRTLSYSADSSDMDVLVPSVTGSTLTLTPGTDPAGGTSKITVRGDSMSTGAGSYYALVEYMATVGDLPPALTITSTPMSGSSVEEGGTITVTATLNQAAAAAMSVALDVSGPATGADAITVAASATSGSATLTVNDDNAVMAMPDIVVVASHAAIAGGSAVLNFSVTEDDVETTYTLAASADTVDEGGTVTITATASQAVHENTEVKVMRDGASTAGDDDYSLEPPLITIMAGDTSGTLTLTATDDHDVEGNESLTLRGMVGDMTVGSVMLAIADNDMEITYTLSGPADMNIPEGGSAVLTATASSAVRADTEVMVMRDGSSTASDADFTAQPITIKAGETTGTTMVMAVEDNEPDSGSGSPEMLTLYGMVDGLQTNSVTFNIWDAAVPALPVIAQLLLAAFLAVGGYRRYLRR